MQGLALVDLAVDGTSVLLTLQVAEDEQRLLEPAVLLEGTYPGAHALAAWRREISSEAVTQPIFIEPPTPEQVVPVLGDEPPVDPAAEQLVDRPAAAGPAQPVQALVADVADPGRRV